MLSSGKTNPSLPPTHQFDDKKQEGGRQEVLKGLVLECQLQGAFSFFQGDSLGGIIIENLLIKKFFC